MTCITKSNPTFPKQLTQISDPPDQIWYTGTIPHEENTPWIAIVGPRRPSETAIQFTKQLSSELAYAGCIIVSGMAYGIDTEAHKGALSAQGKTVAVLPGGLNHIYPKRNTELAKQITHQPGCALLTEYPPNTRIFRNQLIARNRIIAGLSTMTIIVEGAKRSGTRITAEFAIDYNRDVGAVPSTPLSPLSYIPNALIKEGAALITSAQDIWDILDWHPQRTLPFQYQHKEQHPILQCLAKHTVLHVEQLQRLTHIPYTDLQPQLLELELQGVIQKTSHGSFLLQRNHTPQRNKTDTTSKMHLTKTKNN